MRDSVRSSSSSGLRPLLIGQSLELWSGLFGQALRRRNAAPIVARARAQLAAGADAIDVNLGAQGSAEELAWVATAMREALPETTFVLDCGDPAKLAEALSGAVPPLIANAAPLGAGAEFVIAAAANAGAGVVLSPHPADAGEAMELPHLLSLADDAPALLDAGGADGDAYFDCLAYPPAHDRGRCLRSLDLVHALRRRRSPLAPLVAVGNVGHGAAVALRPLLRRCYAAAAVGAGAGALILPAEDGALLRAIDVALGVDEATNGLERWLVEIARSAADGVAIPAPSPDAPAAHQEAWRLLGGGATP